MTPCSGCAHPLRAEFEAKAANGCTVRALADEYGLSKSAMDRHLAKHVAAPPARRDVAPPPLGPPEVPVAPAARTHAVTVLEGRAAAAASTETMIAEANAAARAVLAELTANPDKLTLADRTKLIAAVVHALALAARLEGRLGEINARRILRSSVWRRIQQTIIDTLLPYPDALQAIGQALMRLGDEQGAD